MQRRYEGTVVAGKPQADNLFAEVFSFGSALAIDSEPRKHYRRGPESGRAP
jgi:hypothetical protein